RAFASSRLRWFAASPCRPAAKGLPSSFVELRAVPCARGAISRRYLLNLSLGAWTRTPPRSSGARARFFPDDIGLTSVYTGSARRHIHHDSNFYDGHRFRGCSHSLMFRLPYLLGLQVAPTATALYQAIGQPGRLHHAKNVWLPSTNCGIATYPNRAID